jgi:hypothetical protein
VYLLMFVSINMLMRSPPIERTDRSGMYIKTKFMYHYCIALEFRRPKTRAIYRRNFSRSLLFRSISISRNNIPKVQLARPFMTIY